MMSERYIAESMLVNAIDTFNEYMTQDENKDYIRGFRAGEVVSAYMWHGMVAKILDSKAAESYLLDEDYKELEDIINFYKTELELRCEFHLEHSRINEFLKKIKRA